MKDLSREQKIALVGKLWDLMIAQRKFEDGLSDGLQRFMDEFFDDSRVMFPKQAPSIMIQTWGDELLVSPGHEGKNNEWFSWFFEQFVDGRLDREPHMMAIDGVEHSPATILELAELIL